MLIIGSDHAGVELKENIKKYLENINIEFYDVNIKNELTDDDYPDIAEKICADVGKASGNLGIAICGTGIGMCITCNKVNGIRAALCTDEYMAKKAREHNDANVLCLGARLEYASDREKMLNIVNQFLNSSFEGGRHLRRLKKIEEIENKGDNI